MVNRHKPKFWALYVLILFDRIRRFLKNPTDDSLLLYIVLSIVGTFAVYALSILIK